MSDVQDQGAVPGHGGAAPASGGSAGALIRRAREDAGVHIGALAVALKVPVRRLEALEADRHDLLPDAVFARALARSVCRSLKVDPAPVLALLPQGSTQALTVEGRINEPFRSAPQGPGGWPHLSRAAAVAAAALLVAAVAVYLVPEFAGRDAPTLQPQAPAVPGGGDAAPAAAPTMTEPVPPASAPAAAPAVPAPSVPPTSAVPVPVPVVPVLPAAPSAR